MASEDLSVQLKLFNPFAWAKRPLDPATAFPTFLKTAVKVSEEARAKLRSRTFSFGATSEQRFEWFQVEGSKTVFVFIHGGGWRAGDVASSAFMAEAMAEKGIETVAMGYDLVPHVTLREQAAQVRRGMDMLLQNLRPDSRVFVGGVSAGAHLASTVLPALPEDPRIDGYILLGGLYNLTPLLALPHNQELKMTPEDASALSPMLSDAVAGPARVLVTVGTDDSPAFLEQAAAFAERLRVAGRKVVERREEGLDHLHLSEHMATDSALRKAVLDFMGS